MPISFFTTNATCPSVNTATVEGDSFFPISGGGWDAHRIGWAVAGGCTALTTVLTFFSVMRHTSNYCVPLEQRQIIRILYMPFIYAIISFFSYRYFRQYTYYKLVEVVYESVTLSAFMLLLMQYVACTAPGHTVSGALLRKDKKHLPLPFCCWRFRPTKLYFMRTMKWAVMQYVIVRPSISIAGIITQYYGVLCESGTYDPHFAAIYLDLLDLISNSVAHYAFGVFYDLTQDELLGRRPGAKFWCIKGVIFFTFYQSLIFDVLEGRLIHGTEYWTSINVADGLNALCICIEMVFFSLAFMLAYSASEYRVDLKARPHTKLSPFRAIWDSINFSDIAIESLSSFYFFVLHIFRRRPTTHGIATRRSAMPDTRSMTFGEAFGLNNTGWRRGSTREGIESPRENGEHVRLRPYD